jgi:hypothetical protein
MSHNQLAGLRKSTKINDGQFPTEIWTENLLYIRHRIIPHLNPFSDVNVFINIKKYLQESHLCPKLEAELFENKTVSIVTPYRNVCMNHKRERPASKYLSYRSWHVVCRGRLRMSRSLEFDLEVMRKQLKIWARTSCELLEIEPRYFLRYRFEFKVLKLNRFLEFDLINIGPYSGILCCDTGPSCSIRTWNYMTNLLLTEGSVLDFLHFIKQTIWPYVISRKQCFFHSSSPPVSFPHFNHTDGVSWSYNSQRNHRAGWYRGVNHPP